MKHTGLRKPFAVTALCAAVAMSSLHAWAVTDQEILNDAKSTDQIVTNGLGLQGQRYSTLDALNTNNINQLRPVWGFSLGGEKQRGQEAQPLIKDGVMYITGSYSRVYALDARTGKELWQYDARLPDGIMPCCDVINRGVALYDDLVIFGTLDAKLVALNKDTGKVVWKKTVADYKAGYSLTAAPLVVNGKLITGVSGGEFGVVGKIEAYNAKNGELLWTRPTVEGHMGYVWKDGKKVEAGISGGEAGKTWPGDLWKTGGAAPWLGGYYDPDTDSLLFGTGNPAPWNSHLRPGDNLYSSSRLALDPNDGSIKWHFQSTPHDGWDFDGVNELISFDYQEGGKTIKAAGTADRNGFFYVLDRTNGKFIRGFPFVDKITWAKGLDKERSADLRRRQPSGQSERGRQGQIRVRRAVVPRWQELDAHGLQPGHRAVLRAVQRVGHGHLERGRRLQEGRGLPGCRLHHQAAQRGLHRRAARHRSEDRQGSLALQQLRATVGRRAGHQGQPGVHRQPGRLPDGVRRQDRQESLRVQHRFGHRRFSGYLGDGRRAVRFRPVRLGWCGPSVGR